MPYNSISRIPSRKPFEKVIEMNRKQPVKSTFYRLFFLQKSSGETFREKRVCCQFVVKMLSKPETSTNFGKMSTSKVRKKPDFSGFLSGSGDPIRTDDRSGMKMGKGQKLKMSENLKNLDI